MHTFLIGEELQATSGCCGVILPIQTVSSLCRGKVSLLIGEALLSPIHETQAVVLHAR